jgi:hypothetical protein
LLDGIVPGIDVGSHGPNIIVNVQSSHSEYVIEVPACYGVFSIDSICTCNGSLGFAEVFLQELVIRFVAEIRSVGKACVGLWLRQPNGNRVTSGILVVRGD